MSFDSIDRFGDRCVSVFHRLTLFAIGGATVWAAGANLVEMVTAKSHATIQDLLLLFIFLEIGAMVGIYFKTNHMPIRFLIYIAITALTRHMIDLVTEVGQHMVEIAVIGGTTLMLSISVYIIRMASHQFPSKTPIEIG